MYDILIIGGGPAGLTAAIYARRAGKSVLILEKSAFGGQITWSPKVENFPTHQSISGIELGDRMMEQVMALGADTDLEEVIAIEDRGDYKRVLCEFGAEYEAKTVILAAGAKPRMLRLEKEEELQGSGVCYCAVCDGAFFKGQDVAVYGGGNSALQDAVLLAEICRRVYLIHRRDSFRGEERLAAQLREKSNVTILLNTTVTALHGEEELTGITVSTAGQERELSLSGLFVAIGHEPELGNFAGVIALDGNGYAEADESCLTATPGVFVAGDCRKKTVRQLTTAMADGSAAALAACAYTDNH